jgi:hypothetical protein
LLADLAAFLEPQVGALSFTAAPDLSDEEIYENYITLLRSTATKRMSDEQKIGRAHV